MGFQINNFQAYLFDWGQRYLVNLLSCDVTGLHWSWDDKAQHCFRWLWCRKATSHYLSQNWPRSLSPCCATRPWCVKLHLFRFVHSHHYFYTIKITKKRKASVTYPKFTGWNVFSQSMCLVNQRWLSLRWWILKCNAFLPSLFAAPWGTPCLAATEAGSAIGASQRCAAKANSTSFWCRHLSPEVPASRSRVPLWASENIGDAGRVPHTGLLQMGAGCHEGRVWLLRVPSVPYVSQVRRCRQVW